MNWFILVVILLFGIIHSNETRDEQNNKTKEVGTTNPTVSKGPKAEILKEELHILLDHQLPDVTNQTHDEVKQLNSLITLAVSKNTYSNKKFQPPDENILKLNAHNLLDSSYNLGVTAPSSNTTNTDDITITHNIIESNIISDFLNQTTNTTIWHPNLISTTNLNRELLKLNYIQQNFNFNFNNFTRIELWKSIKINSSTNLLVGMNHNQANNNGSQLILIMEIGFKFIFDKTIAFPKIINEFDLIKITLNKYLVTIENSTFINFYKIVTSSGKYELEKINEINLHKEILHLKLFYKNLEKIRLIFVTEFDGIVSADLYEFEIQNLFNFWLIKTIPLLYRCNSIALLDTGRDYILAFPQMNEVIVYQYENDIFKQLETIETDMITDVSGFSMGGYSYLAVGGLKPQILRYNRGKLHSQTIFSQSFGLVERWFPISARTHRDDLLILVQHRIQFSTHSLNVLQALIWDGEAFNIVPSTPCYRNGIMSDYGITCMIDVEEETDIAGSVIIQHGKNISILVPRGEEPSQLFDLNIELVSVPNPLQQDINEFHSMYKILSKLVDNFDSSMQQIQNTIENGLKLDEYNVIPANWEIDTLEFENTFIDNDIQIGTAFVGDISISKKESNFYLPFMEGILNEAKKRVIETNDRPKRQENISEENIQFEFLNGIPADELLFATGDTIELNGIQEFEKSIYVGNDVIMSNESKINGISIREDTINSEGEVVLPTVECDEIEILENLYVMNEINGKEFNQENMGRLLDDGTRNVIIVDDLIVGGDLNFTRINNVDFDQFLNKIIFKSRRGRIGKLATVGHLFAQTEFGLNHINEIPFPNGFVFRNPSTKEDIIEGYKVFSQSLVTNEIDTDGEINGIKPSDVVTLGDAQFIPGETTFSHIEVTESLEVNGTIKGENFDKFLANPTMTETNEINSSCIFNTLEVEGNVYLIEIENINLDGILKNAVYTDESEEYVNVNALKVFGIVYVETDHFNVTSNLVNNKYSLDNYVTKSASQIWNLNHLNGTIKMNSVLLTGLFNGINVTALDLNSIKTGGDQYIDKRFKFQYPIRSKKLTIFEKINKKSINLLIKINPGENIRIDSNFEVENLDIDYLSTNSNIQSKNDELNGINLNKFNKVRFSLSGSQSISGKFLITSATIDGDLKPNFLNDVSMENVTTLMENKQKTVLDIFSGKVSIHNIIVKSNVTINDINGYNMNKIIQNVIWLDRSNTISNRLTFLDGIVIYSDLEVLSQVNTKHNLISIFDHLVYRDQPIKISHKKVFTNGIKIYGECATEYINDLALSDLLLSNTINHIKHKIKIIGNLQVNNLNAAYINDFDLRDLTSLYHFDEETKTHYLNIDHVQFINPVAARQLYVNGSINEIFNIDEFIPNIVQLDKPIHFDANLKLFDNNLMFTRNLVVEKLNTIDLENYFEHVVHIDEKEPIVLNGNIEFYDEITVNHLRVGGDLITTNILGYDPNNWLNNVYFINEDVHVEVPLKFERGTFQAAAMTVNFLNSIDMSKVLTYNTEQVFNDDFHVSEIVSFNPVRVGGLVNKINLGTEFKNTMMITGNTPIKIPLYLKNVSVHNAVKVPLFINGKLLTDMLRIEQDMIIPQSTTFNEIHTQSVTSYNSEISGIDFELWYMQSLWKRGRETQTVISRYTISNVDIGEGGIHGTGLINNKSMNEIIETRNRDQLKLKNELSVYRKQLQLICMDLRNLIYLTKQQIYYVKYFDNRIILDNGNLKIATKLFFEHNMETYLLLSSADCHTVIYKWNANDFEFRVVIKFKSGFVSEWYQIYGSNSNETVLVSHSIANELKCSQTGVFIWSFSGHSIVEKFEVLINPEYEIKSLYTSDRFVNHVFLITEGNNREPNVFQLDVNGKKENQWKLPINHRRLQFLPTELIFQLALSDGSQLFLINDYKINEKRVKRHNWDAIRELFKPRQTKSIDSADNKILKIGLKNGKTFKQGLFDLGDNKELLGVSQTKIIIPATTTESNIIVGDTALPTVSPIVGSSPKPESLEYDVERIIDNIFEKIVKISDKSQDNKLGSPYELKTPESVVENISNNIVTTTINSMKQIEQTKLQVVNNENVGGPLEVDKENLTKIIDTGYPHVKNISKSFVVAGADSLAHMRKLDEVVSNLDLDSESEILNSKASTILHEGYNYIEKITKNIINTTVNTVLQADELSNKFVLNNDKHDSAGSTIAARNIHESGPIIESNTTKTNPMIATILDTAYEVIEKNAKPLVDTNIKNIADIEDFKEKFNHLETIGNSRKIYNASEEFVIAPTPNYTTTVSIAQKQLKQNNYTSNVFVESGSINDSNTTEKNLMIATILDTAYEEIEKNAKPLVDTNIKIFADIEDFKEKNNHPEIIGNNHKIDSEEFVIAPTPNYTTIDPISPKQLKQSHYNLGASIFNSFRRSRIGNKEIKTTPLQTKTSDESFDRTIGQEITFSGVIASENNHIPEKGSGEIVVLHVGGNENRRMLTAVSTKTNASTIPGKHDTIKIYDDILEGKIYQEIHASKPTGLTAIHIGDQTILAFLEDKVVIQLFIYHGIEGFKNFNEYKLPKTASHLSSVMLPRHGHFMCPRYFLVVTFIDKLWFLEAIMEGNCGVNTNLDCTLSLHSLDDL